MRPDSYNSIIKMLLIMLELIEWMQVYKNTQENRKLANAILRHLISLHE